MRFLKNFVRTIFNRYYHITKLEIGDLRYACDGRIIRSLSQEKKISCAAYIFSGLEQ